MKKDSVYKFIYFFSYHMPIYIFLYIYIDNRYDNDRGWACFNPSRSSTVVKKKKENSEYKDDHWRQSWQYYT